MSKKVINQNGKVMDFDVAWAKMNKKLKLKLHKKYAPCDPQLLFNEYVKAHLGQFNSEWDVNIEK